ncbi:MAG: acyl carrier protein [Candidatus Hydrogenedentes bacterium]|nr:acyl carrier protein [Candidatus Hydrogenedentota bacterium]
MANISAEELAKKIKEVIANRLNRSIEEITDEARFIEDLGADSLDLTELLMTLEEEFNIQLDDDANQIVTVGDAIKYISARVIN